VRTEILARTIAAGAWWDQSRRARRALRTFPRLALAALGGMLLLLTLARLTVGVATVWEPREVEFGEAILYDHAARLLRGEPLYQPLDRPPYTVAAYTPLYYWLVAGARAVAGPGFGPGRALSLAAGLVAAGCVAALAARRVQDVRAGLFAALLFLGLGFAGAPAPWFALYKEDLVGLALSLGSVVLLAGGRTAARVAGSAVLAGLAVLTKQPFAAMAAALALWLWLADRRRAVLFALTAVAVVAPVVLGYEAGTGAFFANVVFAHAVPFTRQALLYNLDYLVRFQGGPLLIAAVYLVLLARGRARRRPGDGLLVSYWGATCLLVVGLARVGSNHNYWIPLAAATAVVVTGSVWDVLASVRAVSEGAGRTGRTGARRPGTTLLAALFSICLLGANVAVAGWRLGRSTLRATLVVAPPPAGELDRLVARVRAEPSEVVANPADVIVLAGRELTLEPYFLTLEYSQGTWDVGPLVRRICAGEIGLLVLDQPLETDTTYHDVAFWPAPMMAAFRQAMTLEARTGGRYVYVPARGRGGGGGGGCGELTPRDRPLDPLRPAATRPSAEVQIE
jgi:hypothetical protein